MKKNFLKKIISINILFLTLSGIFFSENTFAIEKFWINFNDKNNILFSPNKKNKLSKNFVPKNLVEMKKFWIYTLRPWWNEWKIRNIVIKDLKNFQQFCFKKSWRKIPIRSWYRSFWDQEITFSQYSNNFSAIPWTSEHQLWLAFDFWFKHVFLNWKDFPKLTKCFHENADKFGFVLSYWISNPNYNYEPWHFRYVWKKYAKIIKNAWLKRTPRVFLNNPQIYLQRFYAKKFKERSFLEQKIKRIEKINLPIWENISKIFSLSKNISSKIFLKRKIFSSIKNWDWKNFRNYTCAYNYLDKILWK